MAECKEIEQKNISLIDDTTKNRMDALALTFGNLSDLEKIT